MTKAGDAGDGEPIELPIDGELDLHTFHPREVDSLIPDYLGECVARGIGRVRIVHGKGTGALRERVHSILRRTGCVRDFALAGGHEGGWGATIVELRGWLPVDRDPSVDGPSAVETEFP